MCDCKTDTERALIHECLPQYYVFLACTTETDLAQHPRYRALARAMVSVGIWPLMALVPHKKKAPARPAR